MKKIKEINEIARHCLKCSNPSCVKFCPLGNSIPQILEAVSNHNIEEAQSILLKTSLFPFVCGSLCDHSKTCYGGCILTKAKKDGVIFYEVEKYLGKTLDETLFTKEKQTPSEKKVAIIGAGVSGLASAIVLAQKGYVVDLFEKNDCIGGVITESLPDFRFDDQMIHVYEKILKKLDVHVHYQKEFGKNLILSELNTYDIVIFAMGTALSKTILAKNQSIFDGLDILKKSKHHQNMIQNQEGIVIGGGNVAMDVARTLVRNHNLVKVVYRRDLANAPASPKEIEEAIKEGVVFEELKAPIEAVFEKGVLTGLLVEKTRLEENSNLENNSKRKNFVLTGEKEVVTGSFIVEAIGQDADYQVLKAAYPAFFDERGYVKNPGVFQTDLGNIIAFTGDYYLGASTFAKALANTLDTLHRMEEMIK